jgi:hypothetical protein
MPAIAGDCVRSRIRSGKTTPEAALPSVEMAWPLHRSI